jgi:hypothetical protein
LAADPFAAFVRSWNWKAAAFSVILRAPIYAISTLRYGLSRAEFEAMAEGAFSAVAAGVYAACTQAIRDAEPQSGVAFILLVLLPLIALVLDSLMHYLLGTPNLKAGILASFIVSVLSSGFSWYSMRRGALIIGSEGHSFGADMAAIPRLIVSFVAAPFLGAGRMIRRMRFVVYL